MSKFLVDLGDRVGSTAVQAFAGALASASLLGIGDWKTAVVAAGSAAALAAFKALGVVAASAKPVVQTEVSQTVARVEVDTEGVAKAIGNKLLSNINK